MGILWRLATSGIYGGPSSKGSVKTTELQRTCDRCGNVWYVTPKEAKLRTPNALQTTGLKMQSAGNRGKLVGGKKKAMIAEQRLARATAQADRVEQINRCSSCGSVSFTETACGG